MTTTKPPALAGWRKLIAFSMALVALVALVALGRLDAVAGGVLVSLLGVYSGTNAANARARAKEAKDGRTA